MNGARSVALVLILSLFSAQAAVIALSPVLPQIADDLGVSTAAAGQLRTLGGLAAAVSALLAPRAARLWDLRGLMLRAAVLVGAGSLASGVVPSYELLALSQVVVGAGIGALVAGATAAAAEWVPAGERARVLSSALVGQPAAWIVGMPLIGVLGDISWRYGLLALPPSAALLAVWRLHARPRIRSHEQDVDLLEALAQPGFARWALGELFANAGWAGTLVYSGALFVQSYRTTSTTTGFVLAGAGAAFVAGNMAARRFAGAAERPALARLSLLLAVAVPVFGVVRGGVVVSSALFGAAAFVAGGRMLIGNAFGLRAAPEHRLAVMGVRAATTQLGYFVGAAAAGAGLQIGGYTGLGIVLGGFFLASALVQLERSRVSRRLAGVTT
jgi:predicted MFS family arabinose efflux permease